MNFFINIGIIGTSLIFLGKLALKGNKNIQESSNLEFLDKLICYMGSELLAKVNLKYGKQLFITGIIGMLFYNTLGLFMVLVTVTVLIFYLVNLCTSGYKHYLNSR